MNENENWGTLQSHEKCTMNSKWLNEIHWRHHYTVSVTFCRCVVVAARSDFSRNLIHWITRQTTAHSIYIHMIPLKWFYSNVLNIHYLSILFGKLIRLLYIFFVSILYFYSPLLLLFFYVSSGFKKLAHFKWEKKKKKCAHRSYIHIVRIE